MMLQYSQGRDYVFNKAKSTVMKATRGKYPAPLEIIKVSEAAIIYTSCDSISISY